MTALCPGRTLLPISLLVHAVLSQVVSYALRPAVSYAILDLDLAHGSVWLGIASAGFAVPPMVVALGAGRLADRLGERSCLLGGSVVFVLAALLAMAGGDSLAALLASIVLLGLGLLLTVIGQQAWVMRSASPDGLDSAFGIYTFATSCGQMLGPLTLLLPSRAGEESPPFAAITTLVLVSAVACTVLSVVIPSTHRPSSRSAEQPGRILASAKRLLIQPGLPAAMVTSSLVLASIDITLAYLPLLAHERGFAPMWVGVILTARGLGTMLSRISLAALTRRLGRRRVLVVGCAVSAAALMSMAVPMHPSGLVLFMCVYGVAAGTVQPLTMSWVTILTPSETRGVAASLRLVGNRMGQTLLPLAAGALSTAGGAALILTLTGATLVSGAWLSRRAPAFDGGGVDEDPQG
ncbi:MAG: MFS transporter [Actinomycetota bacterium]|nr:MFS transporter [Actinomycetota bacterium]